MAIIKNIKAMKDITINTTLESKRLVEGEVALVRFGTQAEYESLLKFRNFVEHTGPPPAKITKPKSTPLPQTQPVAPTQPVARSSEAKVNTPQAKPIEEPEVVMCKKCRIPMVLTKNDAGQEIYFCPTCRAERKLEDKSQVEEPVKPVVDKPQEEKKSDGRSTISKCPKCGRRKAKDAEYCKKCIREIKAEG